MADLHALLRSYRARTTPGEARLVAVRDSLRAPRRRQGPALAAGVFLGALAAAVLLIALRPPASPTVSALPEVGTTALSEHVQVTSRGDGEATVAGESIVLAWRHGAVDLEVEPNRGVDLTVTTDEASVHVVGTAFRVERDALGTTVRVTRGRVQTDCALGGPALLGAGESRTCLPRTAIGALGRIHALRDAGVSPDRILAEIDAAEGRPDATVVVRNEIGVARVETLLALDRPREAVFAAERTLREAPGARDQDLHRVAGRLHARVGDCAAALPHLVALAAADALGPDATLLTRCSSEAP